MTLILQKRWIKVVALILAIIMAFFAIPLDAFATTEGETDPLTVLNGDDENDGDDDGEDGGDGVTNFTLTVNINFDDDSDFEYSQTFNTDEDGVVVFTAELAQAIVDNTPTNKEFSHYTNNDDNSTLNDLPTVLAASATYNLTAVWKDTEVEDDDDELRTEVHDLLTQKTADVNGDDTATDLIAIEAFLGTATYKADGSFESFTKFENQSVVLGDEDEVSIYIDWSVNEDTLVDAQGNPLSKSLQKNKIVAGDFFRINVPTVGISYSGNGVVTAESANYQSDYESLYNNGVLMGYGALVQPGNNQQSYIHFIAAENIATYANREGMFVVSGQVSVDGLTDENSDEKLDYFDLDINIPDENKYGAPVAITKTDANATDAEIFLTGTKFQLTQIVAEGETAKVYTETVVDGNNIVFKHVLPGTYRIEETAAQEGYDITSLIYVSGVTKVEATADTDAYYTITVPEKPADYVTGTTVEPIKVTATNAETYIPVGSIEVVKTDATTSADMTATSGLLLQLYSDSNGIPHTAPRYSLTLVDGVLKATDITPGTYWISEISAPEGYSLETFVVKNENGVVLTEKYVDVNTNQVYYKVEIKDAVTLKLTATNEKYGNIAFTKTDEETGASLASAWNGTKFELRDQNTGETKYYSVLENGKVNFKNVVPGRYELVETEAQANYLPETLKITATEGVEQIGDKFYVTVTADETLTFAATNKEKDYGDIYIIKTDAKSGEDITEFVSFTLNDPETEAWYKSGVRKQIVLPEDSNIVNGVETGAKTWVIAFENVIPDTYWIRELDAKGGYDEGSLTISTNNAVVEQSNGRYHVTISEDEQIVYLDATNAKGGDVGIVKTDEDDSTVNISNGTNIGVYTAKGYNEDGEPTGFNYVRSSVGANGKITFTSLPEGEYWITELSAPTYYDKLTLKVYQNGVEAERYELRQSWGDKNLIQVYYKITVTGGETLELTATNVKSAPTISINKVDADTGEAIFGALFELHETSGNATGAKITTDVNGDGSYTVQNPRSFIIKEMSNAGYDLNSLQITKVEIFDRLTNITTTYDTEEEIKEIITSGGDGTSDSFNITIKTYQEIKIYATNEKFASISIAKTGLTDGVPNNETLTSGTYFKLFADENGVPAEKESHTLNATTGSSSTITAGTYWLSETTAINTYDKSTLIVYEKGTTNEIGSISAGTKQLIDGQVYYKLVITAGMELEFDATNEKTQDAKVTINKTSEDGTVDLTSSTSFTLTPAKVSGNTYTLATEGIITYRNAAQDIEHGTYFIVETVEANGYDKTTLRFSADNLAATADANGYTLKEVTINGVRGYIIEITGYGDISLSATNAKKYVEEEPIPIPSPVSKNGTVDTSNGFDTDGDGKNDARKIAYSIQVGHNLLAHEITPPNGETITLEDFNDIYIIDQLTDGQFFATDGSGNIKISYTLYVPTGINGTTGVRMLGDGIDITNEFTTANSYTNETLDEFKERVLAMTTPVIGIFENNYAIITLGDFGSNGITMADDNAALEAMLVGYGLTPVEVTNAMKAIGFNTAEGETYTVNKGSFYEENIIIANNVNGHILAYDFDFTAYAPATNKTYTNKVELYSKNVTDGSIGGDTVTTVQVNNFFGDITGNVGETGTVTIHKVDKDNENTDIYNVEFTFEGESYGKVAYEKTISTGSNGVVEFTEIPFGNKYTLIENADATDYNGGTLALYQEVIVDNVTTYTRLVDAEPSTPGFQFIAVSTADKHLVFKATNEKIQAEVTLKKVGADDVETGLPGTQFVLIDGKDNFTATYTLDENGALVGETNFLVKNTTDDSYIFTTDVNGELKITNLPKGDYKFVEVKAPEGYELDTTYTTSIQGTPVANGEFTIDITNYKNGSFSYTATNEKSVGSIQLTKQEAGNTTATLPTDAVFTLTEVVEAGVTANKYTLVYDETTNSYNLSDIPVGEYVLEETKAPSGYDKGTFVITTEGYTKITGTDTYKVTITAGNDIPLELTATNVKILGSATLYKVDDVDTDLGLNGAVFGLEVRSGELGNYTWAPYGNNGTTATQGDIDGVLTFDNLPAGTYKFVEISAPVNYLDSEIVFYTGTTVTLDDPNTEANESNVSNGQFTIDETNYENVNAVVFTATNSKNRTGSIILTKTDVATEEVINQAQFQLFALENDVYAPVGSTISTNEFGTVSFTGLEAGTYAIAEIVAGYGYDLDTFEIANQTSITVTLNGVDYKAYTFEIDFDETTTDVISSYSTTATNKALVGNVDITKYSANGFDNTGEVTEGTILEGVVFSLQYQDENGEFVDYVDENGDVITATTGDGTGTASFTNLPEGIYRIVEVSAIGNYNRATLEVYNGTEVLENNEFIISFETENGNVTEDIYLTFDATNEVFPDPRGQIILQKVDAETGEELSFVEFYLMQGGNIIQINSTDAAGQIYFSDLPLGTYTLVENTAAPGYDIDSLVLYNEAGQVITEVVISSDAQVVYVRATNDSSGGGGGGGGGGDEEETIIEETVPLAPPPGNEEDVEDIIDEEIPLAVPVTNDNTGSSSILFLSAIASLFALLLIKVSSKKEKNED